MPAFPTLASGSVAMYPVVRRHQHRTAVHVFVDLEEQRYAKGSPLEEFDLVLTDMKTADKETVRLFFSSTRGQLDTTWDLTIEGILYQQLQFAGPAFLAEMNRQNLWSVTLRVRQTRKA